MTKRELRDPYPFGLLAVPRSDLVRVHASSGTQGKPTVVGYTRADLEQWTELMARCMTMAGVRPGMVIHNANGYGLFTGGLGFHQGGERIGATVVPVSGGFTTRQAMLLTDLRAEVLVATPSYALAIARRSATPAAIRRPSARVRAVRRRAVGRADASGDRVRAWHARRQLLRHVGDVRAWRGGECLTPATGCTCRRTTSWSRSSTPTAGGRSPGAEGELVFTTLIKEALPLIRYRTGDIGRLIGEPCACGRTNERLTGLRGRPTTC